MPEQCDHEWHDATTFQPNVATPVRKLRCLLCGEERIEPVEPEDAPPTFRPQS